MPFVSHKIKQVNIDLFNLEVLFIQLEIDLLLKTYSEDISRVKNIRISILKSLNDNKLIEKMYDISKKL